MLQPPELDGPTERFLTEDWQPLREGALDGAADILDRLGGNASLMRGPGADGGQVVTVAGEQAGRPWRGQGGTIGEALRNLQVVS